MHPKLRNALRAATQGGGIIDPLTDIDDILHLEELVKAQDAAALRDAPDLLDRPVVLDGVAFYRPSWGAAEWIATCATVWWDSSSEPDIMGKALAWILANCRSKTVMRDPAIYERNSATRIIEAWSRSLHVSCEAVAKAVELLNPSQEPDPFVDPKDTANQPPVRGDDLISRLMREYNRDDDFWLFGCSQDFLQTAIHNMVEREQDEFAKAIMAAGNKPPKFHEVREIRCNMITSKAIQAFIEKCHARGKVLNEQQ